MKQTLDLSVSMFPERFDGGGKTHPKCGLAPFRGAGGPN